ncbi:DASS family sodium-coupled anion symporter [Metallumcola ferriviriculae]|uniref:Sodium-dependent dicarboxylate transporter SdcS n=1 Tax=Metallumcola ferriviriculae TaxID=3039180 RepID=A0AAU0UPB7_9FIRM|nr:DASS family sodium-coupled anion symporter [Desulfitibacteraceae bacterium MK1]
MKSKVYIDRRPLPALFLIEYKNAILLLFSFALFFIFISNKSIPQGMSVQAYQALVIFIFANFLWITNAIPLAITSLMIMGLLASFNVLAAEQVYSFFGNKAVFFIIGAFIISAGISGSGLNKRVSYYVLSRFGDKPENLVLSIFFLAASLSHIMPEHAVAAMLFPILISISRRLELRNNSILGKYMFFALAWGSVLGGVVTFLGGARNPLAVGILEETTGQSIGFLEWIVTVAPPVYLIMILVAFYLKYTVRASTRDTEILKELFTGGRERLGKIDLKEIKALVILVGTIYMWIFESNRFGIANVALISAALFFVLNVISWEDAKKEINWGAIFMYGGAIALGKALVETGLLDYINQNFLAKMDFSTLGFLIVVFTISVFLTEGISNAAVVVILLPLIIQAAVMLNLPPALAVYIVAVPAGLAFMLPMSSPPNAIAFSSGFIKPHEAMRIGFVLNVVSIAVVTLFALTYWRVIGIY